MENPVESTHEGLTIIIRRDLTNDEKETLKEIIDDYKKEEGDCTIGFF